MEELYGISPPHGHTSSHVSRQKSWGEKLGDTTLSGVSDFDFPTFREHQSRLCSRDCLPLKRSCANCLLEHHCGPTPGIHADLLLFGQSLFLMRNQTQMVEYVSAHN